MLSSEPAGEEAAPWWKNIFSDHLLRTKLKGMLLVHLVNILVCSVSWLDIAGCIIARLDGGSVVACALTSSTGPLTPSAPLGKATRQQGKG